MQEDFKKKYTETGKIGQKLINNFYNSIVKISKNIEINSLLEVGCGHGFSTQKLNQIFKNKQIEASDHEQHLIRDARKLNPEINFKLESIYRLDRKDNSFDLVLSLEVLEHLENPQKAIDELKRVTKKYCIVSVPNEPLWRMLNLVRAKYISKLGNTPGHINHWSRKSFIKFLENNFKIIKISKPLPWIIVLLKK